VTLRRTIKYGCGLRYSQGIHISSIPPMRTVHHSGAVSSLSAAPALIGCTHQHQLNKSGGPGGRQDFTFLHETASPTSAASWDIQCSSALPHQSLVDDNIVGAPADLVAEQQVGMRGDERPGPFWMEPASSTASGRFRLVSHLPIGGEPADRPTTSIFILLNPSLSGGVICRTLAIFRWFAFIPVGKRSV